MEELGRREVWHLTCILKGMCKESSTLMDKLYKLMCQYRDHYRQTRKEMGELSAAASALRDVDIAMENHTESSIENQQLAKQVACKKGCYHCCMLPVAITIDEARLIRHYCNKSKIKINKKLLQRQSKAEEENWFSVLPKNQHRCAFLNEKNECSIYEVRPMSCRKYKVLWNSEQCNPYTNPEGKIPNYVSPLAEGITSAAFTASEQVGTISQMVLKALKER